MKSIIIIVSVLAISWSREGFVGPRTLSFASTCVDTLLIFKNLKPSAAAMLPHLSEDLVKLKLYDYYRQRGCFIEGNYLSPLKGKDYEKLVVYYDQMRLVDLNHDRFMDAIIEYWLMPPGASGHCYQPHKAMIVSGTKEYVLLNPDFLDSHFNIDSVAAESNKTFIYGCDYDCSDHRCKRNLRVIIQ